MTPWNLYPSLPALGCSTGPVARRKRAHGRRRRQQFRIPDSPLHRAIAGRRPQQRPSLRDQITLLARLHHRPVGQLFDALRQRMQPLAAGQALAMQHRIHLGREDIACPIALLPRSTKAVGILAPAIEAGPMSRRKRRGFIEKEQLGPASPFHHLAPAAAEFQNAGDPGIGRPAPPQQRTGCGIVDDAAIADKHSARGDRDDFACRQHAILQGHGSTCSLCRHSGAREARARNPLLRQHGFRACALRRIPE